MERRDQVLIGFLMPSLILLSTFVTGDDQQMDLFLTIFP